MLYVFSYPTCVLPWVSMVSVVSAVSVVSSTVISIFFFSIVLLFCSIKEKWISLLYDAPFSPTSVTAYNFSTHCYYDLSCYRLIGEWGKNEQIRSYSKVMRKLINRNYLSSFPDLDNFIHALNQPKFVLTMVARER